jgi:hypothetical protein
VVVWGGVYERHDEVVYVLWLTGQNHVAFVFSISVPV